MGYKGRKGRKEREDSGDESKINLEDALIESGEEGLLDEEGLGEEGTNEGYMDKLSRTVDKMKTKGIPLAKSLGHEIKEGTKAGYKATKEGLGALKEGTENYFDWVDKTNEKIDERHWAQEKRDMDREEKRSEYASSRADRQKKLRDMERDRRQYEMDAEIDELEHQNELMEQQMLQFQKQAEMQKKMERFGQANGVTPLLIPTQNMGGYYGYANPVVQQQAQQLRQTMPLYTTQPRPMQAPVMQGAPMPMRTPMDLINTDYVGVTRNRPQQPMGQAMQPIAAQPQVSPMDLLRMDYVGANNSRMGGNANVVGSNRRVTNAVDFMNTNFVDLNQRRMAGEPMSPQVLSPTLQPQPFQIVFVEQQPQDKTKKSKK